VPYTKRSNVIGREDTTSLRGNMVQGEQDTWFVTFTFPIVIGEQMAEGKVKEWLRRLRQTLGLKEEQIFSSYFLAPQLRGVWHIHMVVKATGLSQLDHRRWEGKWIEITGRKVTEDLTRHHTHRLPGVKRRRDGVETVVSYIRKSEKEVIAQQTRFVGGGTCRIEQVGQTYKSRRNREYVCTLDGIRHYLESRHSREMKESHQFLGIS
jgi:hypothetical protein